MIHISGNDIFREGKKIGYIEGNDIWSYDAHKLGYFDGAHVFNAGGRKVAWLEGEYIYTENGRQIRISDNNLHVSEGDKPSVCRAAIRILLGD